MPNDKKILIVDDDPDIREALQLMFEAAGFTTRAVKKHEDTIAITHTYEPQAIVLDVLLSGQDGREICQKLKDNEATRAIPVIMISAHPDAAISSMAAGANDFMAKPFNIDELIEKVAEHV